MWPPPELLKQLWGVEACAVCWIAWVNKPHAFPPARERASAGGGPLLPLVSAAG